MNTKQTAVDFLYEFVLLKLSYKQQFQFEGLFQQSKEKENKAKLRNQLFKGKVSEIIGENKTIQLIIECNIELQ